MSDSSRTSAGRGLLHGIEQIRCREVVADDGRQILGQALPVLRRVQVLEQAVEMVVQRKHGDNVS